MPIYEFFCPDNRKIYSFYARSLAYAGKTPRCPENPAYRMERMISQFAVTGRAKDEPDQPGGMGDMDDSKFEAAMAEMEREFSGIGDGEPDPKQLARMMRRMTDLTGEKLPPEMDEMIGRLEKGEDPEKLEEEFGDLMDDAGDETGPGGEATAESDTRKTLRKLRSNRIRRDPTLYEITDYLDR